MSMISSALRVSQDKLYETAAAFARGLSPLRPGGGKGEQRQLRGVCRYLFRTAEAVSRREELPAAWEWLTDNSYLLRQEAESAEAGLDSFREQRQSGEGGLVCVLCRHLLLSCGGELTAEGCRIYLDGFQSVLALSHRELSHIPTLLRAAILEAMAELCRDMESLPATADHARSMEVLFGSLRFLSRSELGKLLSRADGTDAILRLDPTGEYARMDPQSREDYLRRVERLAERAGVSEQTMAHRLIDRAADEGRHVGFLLFPPKRPWGGIYIGAVVLVSIAVSAALGLYMGHLLWALLLLLPVWELVRGLADRLLLRLVRPCRLPRMDVERGIPEEGRTLLVLSALLTGPESGKRLSRRLEELFFSCRREGGALQFGLLADLPVADSRERREDGPALYAAQQAIRELNRKYGGGFFLFTRQRRYDGEQWCGFERKRGALTELALLLSGRESTLTVTGDSAALSGISYILTLDTDTEPFPGAVGALIGTALHPLNRPVPHPGGKRIGRGYAILHPRLSPTLESARETDFSLIFAGPGGCDPYGSLCGELYMDAFDCGGFAGKGLIHVPSLLRYAGQGLDGKGVLSHDALEGAYLHGGYVGDAEFADSFPATPLSYFRRQHRWVRGDWQNARWILAPGLSAMDRFRLWESLRRSLMPPVCLGAILLGLLRPDPGVVAAVTAVAALLSSLLFSVTAALGRERCRPRLRRTTRLLTGVGSALLGGFLRLWLLPWEAAVCLSAILTALWRLITRQKLLEWQTFAQTRGAEKPGDYLSALALPAVLGLGLFLFAPGVMGRTAGLLWLSSPLAGWALSLPADAPRSLTREARGYLFRCAGDTWQYFRELSLPADHHIPPDNYQTQPPMGAAHSVSPTNLGLTLCAAVAALDLKLLSGDEAGGYMGRLLHTMEQMPRAEGHFYNWYDTRTLEPLPPALISTVDSGNLCASLLLAERALEELEQKELARLAGRLAADMRFAPLYDESRGLFFISYDAERKKGCGGWYDLLSSEAMLTSYLALARGEVPLSHWRALSRAQKQSEGYRCLASWSGTMFEYRMPFLFLPLYRGSLLDESARVCLRTQRRAAQGRAWGVSESGFFSLDARLRYRYKAHGCAALALKRGQEADYVVSPYSSFLCLALAPDAVCANLRRLERLGMRGQYGFYEALDFTPGRGQRQRGERVCSYMVHHQAMSLMAMANALCDDSLVRRFFSRPEMAAYSLLLKERLPESGTVIRSRSLPPRERQGEERDFHLAGEAGQEGFCILSNGLFHLRLDERGPVRADYGDFLLFSRRYGVPRLTLEGEAEPLPLFPAASSRWDFRGESGCFLALLPPLRCRMGFALSAESCGAVLTLSLTAEEDWQGRLTLELPLIMAAERRFADHPAYWELGLEREERDGVLLLHRLGYEAGEEFFCALAASEVMTLSPVRAAGRRRVFGALPLKINAGEEQELRFALSAGRTEAEALEACRAALTLAEENRASMLSAAASLLGMKADAVEKTMALARLLEAPPCHDAGDRRLLWPYGISGEMPLLVCSGDSAETEWLWQSQCLLRALGVESELVILSDEAGEYRHPLTDRLTALLERVHLEPLLGAPGGVHILPLSMTEAVRRRAVWFDGTENRRPPLPAPRLGGERGGKMPRMYPGMESFSFETGGHLPPVPWQNVLSNGEMGAITAECGSGYLWVGNARECRLTPPPAVPEAVQGSELLWAVGEEGPVSLFAAEDGKNCRVSFAPGLTQWEKAVDGRSVTLTAFLCAEENIRVLLVEGAAGLELCWRMEVTAGGDGQSVSCGVEGGVFRAEAASPLPPFLAVAGEAARWRTDFAQGGFLARFPAADCELLLCGTAPREALLRLRDRSAALGALNQAVQTSRKRLSSLRLQSPDGALDRYLSCWCLPQIILCRLEGRASLYQTLACRVLGRASLYQCGGAFGFRDQLQDGVNLAFLRPGYARERILDCCRHQYEQGDVMHWWHPGTGEERGLRSRCSDDLLWLCWAVCEYVSVTGDRALCRECIPFLTSPPLSEGETDRYEPAVWDGEEASVLVHIRRALEEAERRGTGPHGLPFFGSGDWNDSLNAVEGESVWLGWFSAFCAESFAALLEKLAEPGADHWRDFSRRMRRAAEESFNGRWYERGYSDRADLSAGGERIDSITQSWAVFCRAEHADTALDWALTRLHDKSTGLTRLLTPPYEAASPRPGTVAGYGRGIRENGGQYTHAALWLAMACFQRGRNDDGYELLRCLLPENGDTARYGAEPFVLPADVCDAPGHEGEAGWSWYTGSAGWFLRAAVGEMLGLRREEGRLTLRPALPSGWEGFRLELREEEGGRKVFLWKRDVSTGNE